MPTIKLRIEQLRPDDEEPIAQRLRALDGVFCAVLSHTDESAEVDFEDDRVGLDQIRETIAAFGYAVRLAG